MIESITVIVDHFVMDQVVLHLDVPCPVSKGDPASALMYAPSGEGEDYVQKHFPGVSYKVVYK